mmetsp:Transcript_14040/g.49434  ORF Transcript_14040/g.49434 Transcript_14040/m.49434 type:complete len:378 (-) Transcript_14040:3372-4505(-)
MGNPSITGMQVFPLRPLTAGGPIVETENPAEGAPVFAPPADGAASKRPSGSGLEGSWAPRHQQLTRAAPGNFRRRSASQEAAGEGEVAADVQEVLQVRLKLQAVLQMSLNQMLALGPDEEVLLAHLETSDLVRVLPASEGMPARSARGIPNARVRRLDCDFEEGFRTLRAPQGQLAFEAAPKLLRGHRDRAEAISLLEEVLVHDGEDESIVRVQIQTCGEAPRRIRLVLVRRRHQLQVGLIDDLADAERIRLPSAQAPVCISQARGASDVYFGLRKLHLGRSHGDPQKGLDATTGGIELQLTFKAGTDLVAGQRDVAQHVVALVDVLVVDREGEGIALGVVDELRAVVPHRVVPMLVAWGHVPGPRLADKFGDTEGL